jgi:hypothetical protein
MLDQGSPVESDNLGHICYRVTRQVGYLSREQDIARGVRPAQVASQSYADHGAQLALLNASLNDNHRASKARL